MNEILTPQEAAELLGMSRRSALRLARTGQLPHSRINRRVIAFRRSSLVRYIHQIEVPALA